MIIYQQMKIRNDVFLNVMHPAMFACHLEFQLFPSPQLF